MPEDSGQEVNLKEVVNILICEIESIVSILEEKGIMTRAEFVSKVNGMKANRGIDN
jgi:hypothetical protein